VDKQVIDPVSSCCVAVFSWPKDNLISSILLSPNFSTMPENALAAGDHIPAGEVTA